MRGNFKFINKKFSFLALAAVFFLFFDNGLTSSFGFEGSNENTTFLVGRVGSYRTRAKNGRRRGNLTKDPVLLQNGNLSFTEDDINIPGRGLSLDITRIYNSQINSYVDSFAPEDGSGSWSVENMEYSGDGGESFSKYSYQDAVIELDLKTITPGEYVDEVGVLYFRYQDSSNYYFFLIYADGTLDLTKSQNGRLYTLGYNVSNYNPQDWNHLKIITTGGQIKVYVNDNLEIDSTDSNPFTFGRIALVSFNCHAHFDNVSITDNSTIIQSNNFEDNADGWNVEAGSGLWDLEEGVYSGQNGRSASNTSSLNTTLTCQMKTVMHGEAPDDAAWINFRYQDADNRYYFYITQDKQLVLGRFKNGTNTILLQEENLSYDPLYWNKVKISTVSGDIRVWINEVLAAQILDSDPLAEGKIALEAKNSLAHFDDVYVQNGSPALSDDFNSADYENDTIFGQGWASTYETKIFESPQQGFITIRGADGAKELYVIKSDGSYKSPAGIYSVLTKTQAGYNLREKDGTIYAFDESGNLISITDRNNNQISIVYTEIYGIQRPQTITDTSGRQVNFEYGANSKVSKITYPAPEEPGFREIFYIYDESNNLIEVNYPSGYKKLYTYYPSTGNLNTYTNFNNYTTAYIYSANDKVLEEIDPDGKKTLFDYFDDITNVANSRKEYIDYEFGGEDSLLTVMRDTFYNQEFFTYDDNHNLLWFQDKEDRISEYEYDSQGNRTKIIQHKGDGSDVVTNFTYELTFNQVTSITDPEGNTTQYVYDPANGNLLKTIEPEPFGYETQMSYDEFGNLTIVIDTKGNITEYEYDQYGNRTKTIEAKDVLDYTTIFSYDILSELISTTDANQNTTTYEYDKAGNLIKATDSLGNITEYTYDGNDNRLNQTVYLDNQPITTLYEYDWADNLTKEIKPDNTSTIYSYDLSNFLHLGAANRLTVTDANSNTITYEYDSENRLIKTIDAEGNTTQYSYDGAGNLTSITDPNQNNISYEYDELNRLTRVTHPDNSQEFFTYDDNGNLISKKKPDGNIINYTFDTLNRMITKSYPDETIITYQYDALDNLISIIDTNGTTTQVYNEANRLTQVVYPSGYSVSYEYDPAGNRTKLTYPDDNYLTYTYDELNRLTSIEDQTSSIIVSYSYDSLSRRVKLEFASAEGGSASGGKTLYQYDEVDRLTKLRNITLSGGVISAFDYRYDNVGNRTSVAGLSGKTYYAYNGTYQLEKVQYPSGGQERYLFDPAGNREKMAAVESNYVSYATNNLNQINKSLEKLPDGSIIEKTVYQYDKNGNLTKQISAEGGSASGGNQTFYAYDYENRLIYAKLPSGLQARYAYDAFGRRIKKAVKSQNTQTTNYIYDGDRIIAEYDNKGNLIAKYIYGEGVDEALKLEKQGASYYYYYDALGSVTGITGLTGETIETYSYDVYGQPTIKDPQGNILQTSSINNRFMFTGREFDSETGLYYYRARYYSADLGRFLQRDPSGYETDALNLYSYVNNNPINYVDPTGLRRKKTKSWWADYFRALPGAFASGTREAFGASVNFWSNAVKGGVALGASPGSFADQAGRYGGNTAKYAVQGLSAVAIAATTVAVAAGTGAIPNYSFRIGLDTAHHSFGSLGEVRHIQMDMWIKGVKGSGKTIFRIPMPGLK